jgi:membrane-associated protease RseP (regulator of RpoE activity)
VQDCTDDAPEAPGAAAGILPGDRLVSLDGEPIDSWNESTVIIQQNAGRTLDLVVDREGVEATLEVTPLETVRYVTDEQGVVQEVDGEPQTQEVGFLGIGPAYETVRQPVTAVLPAVGDNIARVGHLILNLPQRMVDIAQAAFGTEERDPNGPLSVVGVGRLAGEITSLDTIPVVDRASSLIGLLASLNVALFVFNLLPLLPLDGGHIAGALFERVRRFFAKLVGRPDPGPLDTARFIPLTFAVIIVFGAMSLLLIYADLVKPISIL